MKVATAEAGEGSLTHDLRQRPADGRLCQPSPSRGLLGGGRKFNEWPG